MLLRGQVVKGIGEGRYFMSFDWVKEQIKEHYGFYPFPGTLNVKLEKESSKKFKWMREKYNAEKLIVPPHEGFCTAVTIPVTIEDAIKGCICLIPQEYTVHEEDVIEIVAPVKIIDELGLNFGDMVRVYIHENKKMIFKREN
jgi:CTP-dependent riboflavin kinase